MLEKFQLKFENEKLPDDVEFKDTNYIIAMAVFLGVIIETKDAVDTGFERFELETLLAEKANELDNAFSSLLDILYEHHFTICLKIIDEYILHLKLSAILERVLNTLDT